MTPCKFSTTDPFVFYRCLASFALLPVRSGRSPCGAATTAIGIRPDSNGRHNLVG